MAGLQDQLIRATTPSPPKIIVYTPPGVGKTTLAGDAKAALIDCEDGAGNIAGLVRTPYLATWPKIREWLYEFVQNPPEGTHGVGVDTLDWMIRRIEEHVAIDLDPKSDGLLSTMGTAHDGFYKARDMVKNIVYREVFPAFSAIVASGRSVLLLAHAANVKMKTPEGFDSKAAAPDLPPYIMQSFIEWADAVLYGDIIDGQRVLKTQKTNLITAKNRYDLEPVEPFDWAHIANKIKQHVPRGSAKTSE